MAKLLGLIVGCLVGWMFGPALAWLFGSWWVAGYLVPFLVGYVITSSSLNLAFASLGREIWSSAMLRPIKGAFAEGVLLAFSAWLLWRGVLLAWWLSPNHVGGFLVEILSPNPDGFSLLLRCFTALSAIGFVLDLSRKLKIWIGRGTRPVRRLMRSLSAGMGGSSRFEGMLEEWANPWKPGMLLLGTSLHSWGWKVGVRDDRHFITIATSRSGKGRSGIIPNLLTWPGSALVIDPKGQNAAVTMEARRKLGQTIYVVDPFRELERVDIDARHRFRFNPMAALRPDALDIIEQCGQLADALIKPDPNADAFWLGAAKGLLTGLIGHVLTWPGIADEDRNLITVHQMLGVVGRENNRVIAAMRKNTSLGGLPMRAAEALITMGDRAAGSVIGSALEQTNWLNSLAMQDALGASEFSLADLKTKPTTVYLVLPPNQLNEHGRFLRLFVSLALNVASNGAKTQPGILFLLDEFYALGPMTELSKTAGLLAGYGVKLWPIVQNLGQLQELYPQNWETFLGNAGLWQVFAANDQTTARYVSERLGQHIAWRKVRDPEGNMEWQPQGATFLRTAVEFARESSRESGNQVVFLEGGSALLLRRAPYDKMFKPEEYSPDPFEPRAKGWRDRAEDWMDEWIIDPSERRAAQRRDQKAAKQGAADAKRQRAASPGASPPAS